MLCWNPLGSAVPNFPSDNRHKNEVRVDEQEQATARKNSSSLRLCALARKRFVLFFFKNKLFLVW